LCSRVFHSHGWWTFPKDVGFSCHLFLGPLFWECPPPTLGLYPIFSTSVFFWANFPHSKGGVIEHKDRHNFLKNWFSHERRWISNGYP
jgi:hypothetical protein